MEYLLKKMLLLVGMLFLLSACGLSSASFLANIEPKEHRVRSKETVYALSRKYNVPTRTIIEENELQPPYLLKKGQIIKIPIAQVHTVKKGETLYSIARSYEVDFSALAKKNKIKSPWILSVGQHLYLPATLAKSSYAKQDIQMTPEPKTPQKNVQEKKKSIKVALPKAPKRSGKFMWPVQGKIVSEFGLSKTGKRNDGINISATKGTSIKAAENGVVAYVGDELKGFGNLALIKHDSGWITAYAHADSFSIKKGMTVKKGQIIGKVGSTGNVKTPQLHFEVRKGTKASNPMNYLKS